MFYQSVTSKKMKDLEKAINELWKCTTLAETMDDFLENVDKGAADISIEVRKLMQLARRENK